MHLAGQNVRGVDPVDGDKTPLHIAAANGHVELVRYLVDHAEVNSQMHVHCDSACGALT